MRKHLQDKIPIRRDPQGLGASHEAQALFLLQKGQVTSQAAPGELRQEMEKRNTL